MGKDRVELEGQLGWDNAANDFYFEWLTLDGREISRVLDETDFEGYGCKVKVTFEVLEK